MYVIVRQESWWGMAQVVRQDQCSVLVESVAGRRVEKKEKQQAALAVIKSRIRK